MALWGGNNTKGSISIAEINENIHSQYCAKSLYGNGGDIKIIVKESPLGFTYKKHVDMRKEDEITIVCRKVVKIYDKTCEYVIIYPTQNGENRIDVDIHPWMIYDKKGMPDHMLKDLLETLDKLFAIAEGYDKCKEIKNEVYKDMFGYTTGPKFQTDEEKILSHGFDLKISFRKRKEE